MSLSHFATKELSPCVAEALELLQQRRADLQRTYKPLRDQISDLETDWGTRPFDFWTKALKTLQQIQPVSQDWSKWMDGLNVGCSPREVYQPIYYELIVVLHAVTSALTRVAIAVTSYREICTSTAVGILQQRQQTLDDLEAVGMQIDLILKLSGVKGQKKCVAAYEQSTEVQA